MDGLIGVSEDKKYHSILVYNRKLTDDEIANFELDDLNNNTYSNNFKKRRHEKGLTVQQIADRASCSKKTIELYDSKGINGCAVERAIKIADILNCDVRDLLD